MNFNNKTCICLTFFIFIVLMSSFFYKEGYSNNNLELIPGTYPQTTETPLLTDSYPWTRERNVGKNTYYDIWWNYPTFRVGSYTQITNNLKYPNNPDDGQCRPAEFCNVLYNDHQIASNISQPLPPAPSVTSDSVRVGYYSTPLNLFLGNQLGPQLPTL